MVDVDALSRRARRASEWGRLRAATRILSLIAPLTLLAIAMTRLYAVTAFVGGTLAVLTVAFRVRDRAGIVAVSRGLAVGLAPLVVALAATVLMRVCAVDERRMCAIACVAIGFAVSAAAMVRAGSQLRPRTGWLEAALVASLTAALGCVELGVGVALVMSAGIVAGAAFSAWRALPVRNA